MTEQIEARYREAVASFGRALSRLVRAYERDETLAEDLLQEIHVALWRSLGSFQADCALKTWVFRVANNVAVNHVVKAMRVRTSSFVSLDILTGAEAQSSDLEQNADHRQQLTRLFAQIHALNPIDRQVMVLHLEGFAAAEIAEVTGVSAANVATKVHRVKQLLTQRGARGGIAA
jgi:RNA polymerase sigma-70 factor (ECF subfamily)